METIQTIIQNKTIQKSNQFHNELSRIQDDIEDFKEHAEKKINKIAKWVNEI